MNPAHPSHAYVVQPDGTGYRVTLLGSWLANSSTPAGADLLIKTHRATHWGRTRTTPGNPIVREVTPPGRMDGCRVFELRDGSLTTYDPAAKSVPQWEAATGLPFPLYPMTTGPAPMDPAPPVVRVPVKTPPLHSGSSLDPERLARIFQEAREATGWTRLEAATRAGVSKSALYTLETGGNSTLVIMASVAGAYGLSLSTIIAKAERPAPSLS